MAVIEDLNEPPPPRRPITPPTPPLPTLSSDADNTNNVDNLDGADVIDLLAKVKSRKLIGNTLFADRRYEEAIQQYHKALAICPPLHSDSAILHANIAACDAKLENWQACFDSSSEALIILPTYGKAQSRRAIAGDQLSTLTSLQTSLDGSPHVPLMQIIRNYMRNIRLRDMMMG
jgi:tetratricopeptide (TPR) repeat protein